MNQPPQTAKRVVRKGEYVKPIWKSLHLLPIIFALIGGIVTGCSNVCQADETTERVAASLQRLPEFYFHSDKYRVEPYLHAAIILQAFGKEKAEPILRLLAKNDGRIPIDKMRVIPLCRMLFIKKADEDFRRPMIGSPGFLGNTIMTDWPLEPIAIVEGVPFLIVRGYTLAGEAETGEAYLDYCLKRCEWNPAHFEPKSEAQKQIALNTLLANKRWKRPLTEADKSFLRSQIKAKK